jgi:hypothetical protein
MRVHLPRRALSTVIDWRTAPSGKNGIVGSFLFPELITSVYGFKPNLKTLKEKVSWLAPASTDAFSLRPTKTPDKPF